MDKHYYAGFNQKVDVTLEDKYGWTIFVFSNEIEMINFLYEHRGDPRYTRLNSLWANTLWKYSRVVNYSK